MRKTIAFLMVLIAISLLVSNVQALEVIVDKYDVGAYSADHSTTAIHPSATSARSAVAQSFRPYFDGANLTVVQLYCYEASATGSVTAKIMGHTGLFGSSGVPNATIYATSDAVTISNTVAQLINFTFPSGYIFDASQTYTLTVEGTAGDVATEYFGIDSTAPINHPGNSATYASSTWTASASDLIFIIYGQDGDAVSFNWDNGDVYIVENTNVYNVTASNATASIGSVDVTTGAIEVGGVTAAFNNTVVNATGDIAAGAVSAGDVTAAGGVTVDSVVANTTITDAVLNLANAPQDYMFWTLLILMIACVILTIKSNVPILNFAFAMMTFGIAAASLGTAMAFNGFIQAFAILMAVICMVFGVRSYRDG